MNNNAVLIPESEMKESFPKAWQYLLKNKNLLSNREHGKFKESGWYQLYPKNLNTWEQTKILLPYMISKLSAFYDEESSYFVNVTTGGFGLTVNDENYNLKYLTGLLNSSLLDWFLKIISTTFRGGYFAANKQYLDQLPIRTIDLSNPEDVTKHDKMISLVEQMIELHKKLSGAKLSSEKEMIQRRIDGIDSEIDRLVYELYELTDEEIKIVEESIS